MILVTKITVRDKLTNELLRSLSKGHLRIPVLSTLEATKSLIAEEVRVKYIEQRKPLIAGGLVKNETRELVIDLQTIDISENTPEEANVTLMIDEHAEIEG